MEICVRCPANAFVVLRGARDRGAVPLGGDVRIAVAGSPEYFERHAKPDTPDDLAAHDRPRYRFSTGSGIYRWGFTQPGDSRRVFEVEAYGSFVSNGLHTMMKAAEQGVGLLH